MNPMGPELVLWTDQPHVRLARAVVDRLGSAVHLIGVGSPDGSADTLAADTQLRLQPHRELRTLLIDRPARFLLSLARPPLLPIELRTAQREGTRILTLEPPFHNASDLAAAAASDPERAQVPRFLDAPGFVASAAPFDLCGVPLQAWISSRGRPEHGSLFARCFDAWATLLRFAEMPELVWGARIDVLPPSSDGNRSLRRVEPPASPTGLRGRMGVMARCPDGSTLGLDLADDAPTTRRRLQILGPRGELVVTDRSYRLTLPDGGGRDNQPHPASTTASAGLQEAQEAEAETTFPDLIAGQVLRMAEQNQQRERLDWVRQTLACVSACLLSGRTQEPESPRRLLELHGY